MSKEQMQDLLTLGYGIVIYAILVSLFIEASNLLDVPECKIYHQSANVCEEWVEKVPGVGSHI